MNRPTPTIHPHTVRGQLPTWFWRALYDAERAAHDCIPLLVIEEGGRSFVVIEASDYNRIAGATQTKAQADAEEDRP